MNPVPRQPPSRTYLNQARALGLDHSRALTLYARGLSESNLRRLSTANVPQDLLSALVDTRGLWTVLDAEALSVLWRSQFTAAEILDWAHLGRLDLAQRLVSRDIGVEQARSFPLSNDQGLGDLLRLVQAADQVSIRRADLRLWFTGGVLRLQEPYLHAERFQTWRAVGAARIGMRRAALSCAAGLSPQEAVSMVEAGTFDTQSLHLLAAMR